MTHFWLWVMHRKLPIEISTLWINFKFLQTKATEEPKLIGVDGSSTLCRGYGNLAFSWSTAVPASLNSDLSDEVHMYSPLFSCVFFFKRHNQFLRGKDWLGRFFFNHWAFAQLSVVGKVLDEGDSPCPRAISILYSKGAEPVFLEECVSTAVTLIMWWPEALVVLHWPFGSTTSISRKALQRPLRLNLIHFGFTRSKSMVATSHSHWYLTKKK